MVASTPGQPLGDGVGANLMAVRIYTSVVSVSTTYQIMLLHIITYESLQHYTRRYGHSK
jgi:hypothetical protein